jgi:cardiolipin synthase
VLITTPYFVPDESMLAALTSAALRGVDVRVLVPRSSDICASSPRRRARTTPS